MSDQSERTKQEKVETIRRWGLGQRLEWKEPTIEKTVGPFFPDAFKPYVDWREKYLGELRETFVSALIEKLNSTLNANDKDQVEELEKEDWWDYLKTYQRTLESRKPVWFAGGFGNFEYKSDAKYWATMQYFTLDELLILSLGVDPAKAGPLEDLDQYSKIECGSDLVIEYLADRSRQFSRQFNPDGGHGTKILPKKFLAWVDFIDLEVDEAFLRELRKIYQPTKQSEKIDPREKTSLLQMIAVMAEQGYSYDSTKRSLVPNEIYEDAQKMGVQISKETIRNHLKSAVSALPVNSKPK